MFVCLSPGHPFSHEWEDKAGAVQGQTINTHVLHENFSRENEAYPASGSAYATSENVK
jgi:hypothetical protein